MSATLRLIRSLIRPRLVNGRPMLERLVYPGTRPHCRRRWYQIAAFGAALLYAADLCRVPPRPGAVTMTAPGQQRSTARRRPAPTRCRRGGDLYMYDPQAGAGA
jgi:hypothetical protein